MQIMWLPQAAESKGQQNRYFKWRKNWFLAFNNFKLLSQTQQLSKCIQSTNYTAVFLISTAVLCITWM